VSWGSVLEGDCLFATQLVYEACLNVSEKLEPVALVVRALALMTRSPPFNVLYSVGLSKPR
jgi:hypothetical protein